MVVILNIRIIKICLKTSPRALHVDSEYLATSILFTHRLFLTGMSLTLSYLNYRGLTVVGSTIIMAVVVILIPFILLVCLSVPLIKPSNWLQVSVMDAWAPVPTPKWRMYAHICVIIRSCVTFNVG